MQKSNQSLQSDLGYIETPSIAPLALSFILQVETLRPQIDLCVKLACMPYLLSS